MFDVHDLLMQHYEKNVRLGRQERDKLGGYRDTNLDRVRAGLDKLAEERHRTYPHFTKALDQGSYAMHTLNQHPENDYDIDTALIFEEDALPTEALAARKRIVDALLAAGGNFSKDPEARTNAVTVWYAEGYHVDLAIYRQRKNWLGETLLEHAGADWTKADPDAITKWFRDANDSKSPKGKDATVEAGQFRRVVRYVKAFSTSRSSWSLPGGLILSALTAECYQPNPARDDKALYDTMKAISSRLFWDVEVASPIDGAPNLTSKDEYKNQVKRLREKLKQVLPKLDVLFDRDCTEEKARRAWNHVFKHPFWTEPAQEEENGTNKVSAAVPRLKLVVGVATVKDGGVRWKYNGAERLPKRMWLRFSLDSVPVEEPYEAHWLVRNSGDEAVANDDLEHENSGTMVQWEQTAYKGDHKMICELRRGDGVLARGERTIRISTK